MIAACDESLLTWALTLTSAGIETQTVRTDSVTHQHWSLFSIQLWHVSLSVVSIRDERTAQFITRRTQRRQTHHYFSFKYEGRTNFTLPLGKFRVTSWSFTVLMRSFSSWLAVRSKAKSFSAAWTSKWTQDRWFHRRQKRAQRTFALLSETTWKDFHFVFVVVQRHPRSTNTDDIGQWIFTCRLSSESRKQVSIFG